MEGNSSHDVGSAQNSQSQKTFCVSKWTRRVVPVLCRLFSDFASELLRSSSLPAGSICMDPWNGSGTTTTAASLFQHNVLGYDLNPVMVTVARGRLLPRIDLPSIPPLLEEITKKALEELCECGSTDPLLTWFGPAAATSVRSTERSIHKLLVSADSTASAHKSVSQLSAIASFFYVGLFRAVRHLLQRFTPSNPTWAAHNRKVLRHELGRPWRGR